MHMLAGRVRYLIGVDTDRDTNTAAIVEAATGGVLDDLQPLRARDCGRTSEHCKGRRYQAADPSADRKSEHCHGEELPFSSACTARRGTSTPRRLSPGRSPPQINPQRPPPTRHSSQLLRPSHGSIVKRDLRIHRAVIAAAEDGTRAMQDCNRWCVDRRGVGDEA